MIPQLKIQGAIADPRGCQGGRAFPTRPVPQQRVKSVYKQAAPNPLPEAHLPRTILKCGRVIAERIHARVLFRRHLLREERAGQADEQSVAEDTVGQCCSRDRARSGRGQRRQQQRTGLPMLQPRLPEITEQLFR